MNMRKILVSLAAILTMNQLLSVTDWVGSVTGGPFDDDISIGACYLGQSAVVIQPTANRTATVKTGGGTVDGRGNILHIDVPSQVNFTFDITGADDLTFEGGPADQYFNIIQTGQGTVTFKLRGGRKIIFKSSNTSVTGGASYFCALEHGTLTPPVGLIWQFDESSMAGDARNSNAVIELQDTSRISFIALNPIATSTEVGGLGIYAGNDSSYSGTLILHILNHAAFLLMGHQYNASTLAVDLATLAGKTVNMQQLTTGSGKTERFVVINRNEVLPQLFCDPTRTLVTVDGQQQGYIWGAGASVTLKDGTYLDYIGTTLNCDPLTSAASVLADRDASAVLKSRNASALIIDGAPLGANYSAAVSVQMEGESGMFFRSACDAYGHCPIVDDVTSSDIDFVITPTAQLTGAGNIVFDIEAAFQALGNDFNVINVLSREVVPTGGHIEIGGMSTLFPEFTFATSGDYLSQYGKACIMVNDSSTIFNTLMLRHDDFIHVVNPTNTPDSSEPTYIGGDTFKLVQDDSVARPTIDFVNAEFRLHTSAALTGVDLLVTQVTADQANSSTFRFYGNGYKVDNGTGRALVLGTEHGAHSYSGSDLVDNNSYLNIYQTINTSDVALNLNLNTSFNDHEWISQIPVGASLTGQYSVHTLFLGSDSNIQVGSQTAPAGVTLTAHPQLLINNNFFAFTSQGGLIGQAELGATTGQGAIFVDKNGTVAIDSSARANFGVMVVKGDPTSTITLPKERAYFSERVGISHWNIDLTDATKRTLVSAGQHLSDFTLDWMAATKDFDGGFVPFDPTGSLAGSVTAATLYHIPVVAGEVDEFLVKRSRLGDQVHLMVDGGTIRDLLFLRGFDSGEAATGLLAIKNDGEVGIGNNETRRDSPEAAVVLGINGLTIAPDGNAVVNLNTDIVINNLCPILPGPNFGVSGAQTLTINSTDAHEIRVKNGGELNLSTFNTANKQIVFTGNVKLIFEPGSRLVLGDSTAGGTLTFSGSSVLQIQPAVLPATFTGTSVADMDNYRAQLQGKGTIIFDEGSQAIIAKGACVGVESTDDSDTNFTLSLRDSARMQIGNQELYGGAVQIGNTVHRATTVQFTLELNGTNAVMEINSQGFLGIGAGIANKQGDTPNSWRIGALYDVAAFTVRLTQGTLKHNMMHKGSSTEASLWAIGPATRYRMTVPMSGGAPNFSNIRIYGGGNIIRTTQVAAKTYPVLNAASDYIGITAAQPLLRDGSKIAQFGALAASGTPANFFKVLRTNDIKTVAQTIPRANFAQVSLSKNKIAYVYNGAINRDPVREIFGGRSIKVSPTQSLATGAVDLYINRATGLISRKVEITQ